MRGTRCPWQKKHGSGENEFRKVQIEVSDNDLDNFGYVSMGDGNTDEMAGTARDAERVERAVGRNERLTQSAESNESPSTTLQR